MLYIHIHMKYNILNHFYIIVILFLQISYSKTTNTNPVLSNVDKIQNSDYYTREENGNILDMIEKMKERERILLNNINALTNKNQYYKLKIEVNKIYIKILYSLIFIFLFIIINIIIIKFYCQYKKKENDKAIFGLKK